MTGPRPARERGVILINVLLMVALAASMVMLMIAVEDPALDRTLKLREAAQAQAIARGGEMSAVVALRRDILTGPDADYPGEAWGGVADHDVPIANGRFSLAIADAQARFNINSVMSGDAAAVTMLARIAAAAGVPPEMVPLAIAYVRMHGPIADLRPLAAAGLDPAVMARVSALITALPYETKINLNTASEPMLAVLIGDAVKARLLVRQRESRGFLTAADFRVEGISPPAGAGFTSDMFWVRTRATIGGTSQQLTSLLVRKPKAAVPTVEVAGRWIGSNPPVQAPPLPS